jgi:hypothetical protein
MLILFIHRITLISPLPYTCVLCGSYTIYQLIMLLFIWCLNRSFLNNSHRPTYCPAVYFIHFITSVRPIPYLHACHSLVCLLCGDYHDCHCILLSIRSFPPSIKLLSLIRRNLLAQANEYQYSDAHSNDSINSTLLLIIISYDPPFTFL